MSCDVYSPGLLAAVAQRLALARTVLSLARGEDCIYLKSYDLRTLQVCKVLRMPTAGMRIANLEYFSDAHGQWCLVKEAEELTSHRRDLLVNDSFFHLGLDILAGWRNFIACGAWEPTNVAKEAGYAQYFRLDRGPLEEVQINRSLPKELAPAAVIGLKSGPALPWLSYPLVKAGTEFKVHIYDCSAMPNICSPTGVKQKSSLGLGLPIYDQDGNCLLAEVFPVAIVPSIFFMVDLGNFAGYMGTLFPGRNSAAKLTVSRVIEQSVQAIKLVQGGGSCAQARMNLVRQTAQSEISGFLGQRGADRQPENLPYFDCPPALFQTARELDLMD